MKKFSFAITFAILSLSQLFASEPQHEYEKPGFHEGHSYDGILPEETIDLFTGGLIISQQDFHINNASKMDRFESMLTRRYSSKIFRQQLNGSSCSPTSQSIDDEFAGQGWSAHFGRLWDWDQFSIPNGHPVLELPNGSRHVFSADSDLPNRLISRSGWVLSNTYNNLWYDACSPGPESVCLTFVNDEIGQDWPNTQDIRGGRKVLHAIVWENAGGYLPESTVKGGPHVDYDRDASGHVWPKNIKFTCQGIGAGITTFNWDNTKLLPTMDSITTYAVGGQQVNYTYQYIIQNGHVLLERSTTPEGRTYKYDYDPVTNELIRITISTDPVIDTSDAVIEYTYATHTFPINSFFLSSACTRVVTQKKVKKSDGSFDVWTYDYPSAAPHMVTVTDPKGNKREVTFQGYSLIDPYVWNVGIILRDESFEGSASLMSVDSTYDFKQVSNVYDPEASSLDILKTPVLLTSTKTYSQTGQQTITSFGTSANYDRYGNPDFKIEKNFDGSTLRTTQYEYEYKDGDKDDYLMETMNYVRDLSKITVLDAMGQEISKISYEHYSTGSLGAVQNSLTWDSETGTNIRKTYEYNLRSEAYRIYEQTEGADWLTESGGGLCNGITDWWTDPLNAEAGGPWNAEIDWAAWVYTKHFGPSYEPPTSFSYDLDLRLTQITPPEGDATNINYDDTNRKVTVTQGTALSAETYDNRGRLTKRETNISPGTVSTQTFEYDVLNNLTKQSEKTLSPIPDTFINKTYDALNRVTSITTADGTTTYTYNGPDVNVTVQSEMGDLVTTMKYDAGGRLIKVVEPNGIGTTYAYDAMDRLIRVCHQDNDDICDAGHTFRRTFVYSTRGKLLSETHPESGTTTYKYDIKGRMIEKKFAGMKEPILYTYDMRDRLLNIDYPNDPDVSLYYDGDYSSRPVPGYETQGYTFPRGHLTGMVDSTGTTIWSEYWLRRELLRKDIHLNDSTSPIMLEFTYDSRGNLSTIKYPSAQVVKTYRNDANAINQITRKFGSGTETNLLNSVTYNAALLPDNLAYANGVNLSITSDVRNRPDIINSPQKLTLDYRYNIRGLIDQIGTGQNGGPTQLRDITYDSLGRLKTFLSDVSTLTYNYDNFGNLTSKTGPVSAGPFTYLNNRIIGQPYSTQGNQLSVNGKTLIYNDENRIKQITDASTNTFYTYDGQGNRVKSLDTITGKSRYFIYDDGGGLLAELSPNPNGTLYIDKEFIQGPTGTIATASQDEIPRGLKIYDLNGKSRLEWQPSTNCGIAGYNVYRSTAQNGTYTLQNTSGPITTGIFDDSTAVECTTYWYQIKTVYTGGAEGSSSEKTSHKLINYKAVLYNSPSPGVAPLNVTFTYNKGGTCPAVGSTSYSLNFGDGTTQNFTAPGTVSHTYTSASSCYPFCIAKLTVTFNNGIVATQSRLTSMSTDLVTDENFDDGIANGFSVVSGTWTAGSGTYSGSSTGSAWGISPSGSSCNNCVIQAQANTAALTNKNAFVVFGYVDSKNFQYAGYEISPNRWVIGDVVNNVVTPRATFTQTLGTGVWHSLEVKLEAASKTVTLKGNGVTRCMYTFSTLYSLPIGFAIKGTAQSSFDNFKIAPAYTVTTLHTENFNDGVANGYIPVTGTWSIASSRYRGTIATATDAVSQTPVASFNSGVIAGDIRVVTNNGWYVFDYVNSTNFKFAGIDATADLWVIGDVINGNKVNRAQFAQTLNTNTIYPVKILLEGSTVSVINSNVIKVRWTFASLTARPVALGMRGSATCDFDNVLIYTETFPTGAVSNPPAVSPPTSTAGAADVAVNSYANPPFYYNLNDHLGTARITMNQAGAVTSSVEYFPFGELKSSSGCAASSQRFTGKLFDNESGLQYFGARYLSNDLTRFTATDPANESFAPHNPQSWNRYAYSMNDPVNLIDPDGREGVAATLTLIYTAVEGAAVTVAAASTAAVVGVTAVGTAAGYGIGRAIGTYVPAGNGQTIDQYYTDVFTNIYTHFSEEGAKPKDGTYRPDRTLPKDKDGNAIPDTDAAHTQLGEKISSKTGEPYTKAREWNESGRKVKDVDFTDHGRKDHPNPHEHKYDPKTGKRGPKEPLEKPQ